MKWFLENGKMLFVTLCFSTCLSAGLTPASLHNETIQERIDAARQEIDNSYAPEFSSLSAWFGTTIPAFLLSSFAIGRAWRADNPNKWPTLIQSTALTLILSALSHVNAKAWGYLLPMGGWTGWDYFGRFCYVNTPGWVFSIMLLITKQIDACLSSGGKYRYHPPED